MNEYLKVNVKQYVAEGIKTGALEPFEAEKFARIIAIQGEVGKEVVSWVEDSKTGEAIEEKRDIVKLDSITNNPGWIATKADEFGNPIIDRNNHMNQWIIDDSTFNKKYELDEKNPGIFKPKGGIQTFVEIPDNIILNQWGSDMKIEAGGYINITTPEDMYGISARDFEDTYKKVIIEENKIIR